MPIVVRKAVDGWLIEVPACSPRDGIAIFDISSKKGQIANRGVGTGDRGSGSEWIEIAVSSVTLTTGAFNEAEMSVSGDLRPIKELDALSAFVTTDRGHAQWRFDGLDFSGGPVAVIGDEVATSTEWPNESTLSDWCAGS